jgi:hypothetical protein
VRKLFTAALAASLGICSQGWGQEASRPTSAGPNQEPARLQISSQSIGGAASPTADQRLADAIADQLNHSPALKHFRVNITVSDGTAALAGIVQTPGQRDEVLRLAQTVSGVTRVLDRLQVASGSELLPVQAAPVPSGPFQTIPPQGGGDKDKGPKVIIDPKDLKGTKDKVDKQPPPPFPPLPFPPVPGAPGTPGAPGALGGPGGPPPGLGGVLEPLPLQGTPPGFPSATQPPPMPPYAWPTYAPYNNYSRVAYPNLYPYESFPFIGPIYPFPKIPLGWRSVTLQWEDGHWWLGRNATGHDWWRIRYW